MAGNTRGKMKEHFEGIHRDFDWSLHHINASLLLIAAQLHLTEPKVYLKDTEEETEDALMTYPLYQGVKALGEGIKTLDELAQNIYASL